MVIADFYTKFNTGSREGTLIPDIMSWGAAWDGSYPFWEPVKPYTKYCYMQTAATIKPDGTTLYDEAYWKEPGGHGWAPTPPSNEYIQHVFDLGFVPKLDLWVTNFDCADAYGNPALTENSLRLYLRNLNAFLNGRQIIWEPCWEFNFPTDGSWGANWGTGGRGRTAEPRSWYVPPATYNMVMGWARNIINSENLTSVLLGVHMNAPYWSGSGDNIQPPLSGFNEYLDGFRKADILGSSSYEAGSVAIKTGVWEQAKRVWDLIGTGKPWVFSEYGILPWLAPYPIEIVDATYALLDTYPFVKGICWYLPTQSNTSNGVKTTVEAIRDNAAIRNQGGSILISSFNLPFHDNFTTLDPKWTKINGTWSTV